MIRQSMRYPLAVAGVAVAAAAVLHVHDPHAHDAYGFCPFHALTGLWCPGCGGLRAVNDLTRGDLVASLGSNVFVAPLVVALAAAWVRWTVLRWRGTEVRMRPPAPAVTIAVSVLVVAFTVVRNTPWGAWLAPT